MAELLKGAPVAAALLESVSRRVAVLREKGTIPGLAVLRVGEKPDDMYYENAALRRCEKAGIFGKRVTLPDAVTAEALQETLLQLNRDASVHGVLVLRPLPGTLNELAEKTLAGEKDVDGITPFSMAKVYSGQGIGYAPCTARACMEVLKFYGVEVSGKSAAVLGRSTVIGRPVASLLTAENATVTVCHSKTTNAAEIAKKADILISAMGRIGVCTEEYMGNGQILLDVGMNALPDGTFTGDADFDAAMAICKAVTPVPGGIGAVTTAVLMSHVTEAAERAASEGTSH